MIHQEMYPAWDTLQHAIRAWWREAWQKAGKTLPVSFFVNSLLGRCKKGTGRGWEKSAKSAGNSGRSRPSEKGGGDPRAPPLEPPLGKREGSACYKSRCFCIPPTIFRTNPITSTDNTWPITSRGLNSQHGPNLITLFTRNCQVEMLFLSDIIIRWNKTFLLFLLPQQTR